MKDSTKHHAKGTLHAVKGKIREETGKLTGNHDMQVDGIIEQISGKIQRQVASVEKSLGR